MASTSTTEWMLRMIEEQLDAAQHLTKSTILQDRAWEELREAELRQASIWLARYNTALSEKQQDFLMGMEMAKVTS